MNQLHTGTLPPAINVSGTHFPVLRLCGKHPLSITLRARIAASLAGMLLVTPGFAADGDFPAQNAITLPEITVSEEAIKNQSDISINAETLPAQVEIISSEKAAALPVNDYHDLFRSSAGVVPINFGQGDIGNGFSLRGFSGDHGQDVAVFVDGVPINVPNHAHAHGLADDAWVLPEMIDKIEIIKGPFSAQYGNFALGGVVNITTKRAEDHPSLKLAGGSFGQVQALGTYSHALNGLTPFLLFDVTTRDGYRDNAEYNRYNLFNKLTVPLPEGALSVTARAVKRDGGASGYLPLEDLENGLVSRRAAVNDTDGFDSEYYGLVANYIPNSERGLNLTLYAGSDELNRFAAFGFSGETSTQRLDHSERSYAGWRAFYNFTFGERAALTLGTDGEYDDGKYQRIPTDGQGHITVPSRDRRVTQLSTGLFAQGQYKLIEQLKVVGGVRYDRFDIDVDNRILRTDPVTGVVSNISGEATPDVVSPKIGLVFSPSPQLDIFTNAGKGFRSPAAEELSPNNNGLPNYNLDPPELFSADIGAKFRPLPGLTLGVDYYTTETEQEIVVRPEGVLNVGNTEREGYELSLDYAITPNLDFYASYAAVDAHVKNSDDLVVNVPYDTQTLGADWRKPLPNGMKLVIDGYVQRYSRQPLTSDARLEAPSVTRIALKTSLSKGPVSGFVQFTYFPDDLSSESTFDFGTPPTSDGRILSGVRLAPNPDVEALVGVRYEFE